MSFSHSLCGVPSGLPLNTESEKLQRERPNPAWASSWLSRRCAQVLWLRKSNPLGTSDCKGKTSQCHPDEAVKELANPCSLQLHTDHISAVWLSLFYYVLFTHLSVVGRKTMRWCAWKANRHTISLLHQATSTVFLNPGLFGQDFGSPTPFENNNGYMVHLCSKPIAITTITILITIIIITTIIIINHRHHIWFSRMFHQKSETSRLVGKWNAKNPSDAIGVSDRLLAVNGLTELKETLAEDLWLGEAAQRAVPEGTLSYILYTILLFFYSVQCRSCS